MRYILPFLTTPCALVVAFQPLPLPACRISSRSPVPPYNQHHYQIPQLRPITTHLYSGQTDERPVNEFSRTVPPDKVLKLQGKHQTASGSSSSSRMPERQYSVEIDATEEECAALARRFDVPSISSLEAFLSLSPEGSNVGDSARGILVEGSVEAHLTRTCVRTNEEFAVDMEFPVYALVRPVESSGGGPSLNLEKALSFVEMNRDTSFSKKNKNVKNQSSYEDAADEIDPAELLKIQTMLEGLASNDENVDDILMEDEYIYATTGALDVGELVSQLFWLELDPYPRKPGSEFFQYSISG